MKRHMKRLKFSLSLLILCLLLAAVGAARAFEFKRQRIAVVDFRDSKESGEFNWISNAIPETLTTKLSAVQHFQLVERTFLQKVIYELGGGDVFEPNTAIRIGKILGAQKIVLGSFACHKGTIRINARFVDVETGGIDSPGEVTGPLEKDGKANIFNLFDQIARELIKSAKINL